MSSATPTTPPSDSTIDDTAAGCVAIFREITGLANSKGGNEMSDARILSDPIDSFDIDSLTTMEFIMAIEERFNVELNEKAVNRCANIGELVALVNAARRV